MHPHHNSLQMLGPGGIFGPNKLSKLPAYGAARRTTVGDGDNVCASKKNRTRTNFRNVLVKDDKSLGEI